MRRCTIMLTVTLALVAFSGASAASLVLEDGTVLEVQALQLKGGFVYVTLANGQRVAYQSNEIDLAASGLLPNTVDRPPAAGRTPAITRPPLGTELGSTQEEDPLIIINNDDVEHVEQAGEDGYFDQITARVVLERVKTLVGDNDLTVTGFLHSLEDQPVSGVTLQAEVRNLDGEVVLIATSDGARTLPPKQIAAFRIAINTAEISGVKVGEVRVKLKSAHLSSDGVSPEQAGGDETLPEPKAETDGQPR